jgi:tRNA(fMet)-specific endonuclease VapC
VTFALDTDTLSLLVRGQARVSARYAEVVASGSDEVTIPAVVRIEVLRGRFDAVTKAADGPGLLAMYTLLVRTEVALSPFRVLPITQSVSALYDRLRSNKKLKKGNRSDLLIASIAIDDDAILITRNTKDFVHIPGLRLENWAD